MRVYHYLPAEWAIDDIKKRRLKISKFNDLNDPFEFLNGEMSNRDYQKALDETMKEMCQDTGVVCFSKNSTDPLLWGHYADKHKGICLGFDITDADEVIYISNKKSLCSEFEKELNSGIWNSKEQQRILRNFFLSKYEGWQHEDEVRVIAQLEEKDKDGNFFINFSRDLVLKQVLIGVRCNLAGTVLKHVDEHVEVIQTRLDFETFKVIESYKLKYYKI